MRVIPSLSLAGALLAAVACRPGASPDARVTKDPAPFMGGVDTTVLRSTETGREYQISVAVPLGYGESDERYSVLVGVDANGQFGTLVETARLLRLGGQIPPLVIVGVGFPVGGYQTLSRPRRLLELSPTRIAAYVDLMSMAFPDLPPPEGSGGGGQLLRFITNDVIPFVDANYRTEGTGRALYGHSLGGSFAFYVLLSAATPFSRYIIASPSLWWDDRAAFTLEEAYAKEHESLPARAFFSVGLDESDVLTPPVNSGRMVSNLRDLMATLDRRGYDGFTWTAHFFEGENHQSVVGPSISRGLRYIYQR